MGDLNLVRCFKLHLLFHNPTSADDKSWQSLELHHAFSSNDVNLYDSNYHSRSAAYDNRLKGKQLYNLEQKMVRHLRCDGNFDITQKLRCSLPRKGEKTSQGNLLLNQLEIEWKSILLSSNFRSCFVWFYFIPLLPVEVIIMFDVIGSDEVEKVV